MSETSLFSFNNVNREISIYSVDSAKTTGSPYTCIITGYLPSIAYSSVTFIVYVTNPADPCLNTVVSPSSLSTFTYNVGSGSASTPTFSAFTETLGSCGSFTYSTRSLDSYSLDTSIFTFDATNRRVTVNTANHSKAGTYNLLVTGTLNSGVKGGFSF